MKYVFGNWKSNKNANDLKDWFHAFSLLPTVEIIKNNSSLVVGICVPSLFLPLATSFRDSLGLPIKMCAQDVSPFVCGAHTGEIAASQLSEFAEFTLVGHSERRKDNKEDDAQLSQKVMRAGEAKLQTIYCVQSVDTVVPQDVTIVAYEPLFAIGTGVADSPENANSVVTAIKAKWHVTTVLYGGSVAALNVRSYLQTKAIDGVLPGGASLDPHSFGELIGNAARL